MSEQKKRIHVVINLAAGKDEPILNTINDVFRQHNIKWTVSVTQKYGDATEFARTAERPRMILTNLLTADIYGQSKGGHNNNRNGPVHPVPSRAAGA